MSGSRTPELNATLKVAEQIMQVRVEIETWGRVQCKILDAETAHTELLGQINRAVQRKSADADGDPLGDLIRQLLSDTADHTAALKRVEAKVDALSLSLRPHVVG